MKQYSFDAVIFDLDGVITKTALLHAAAWKAMFDDFLQQWSQTHAIPFAEFTHNKDYLPYVDGKTRYEGVKSFLNSRAIELPYGDPGDHAQMETICGLGNRKNNVFNDILKSRGVETYDSTVSLIHQLKENSIPLGVASSSRNCKQVLERANLLHLFNARVDGTILAKMGLPGKPKPDIFIETANILRVGHQNTVVIEDAVSGVEAAKNGKFGLIIGIAREGNHSELKAHGAHVVVDDLEQLGGIEGLELCFNNRK